MSKQLPFLFDGLENKFIQGHQTDELVKQQYLMLIKNMWAIPRDSGRLMR
jgi:hypothetical protein